MPPVQGLPSLHNPRSSRHRKRPHTDDFLLFSNDKRQLTKAREQIGQFLTELRLKLHPRKNTIFPVKEGTRFLGYRVFPTHRLLVKENVWRFLRRVRRMQKDYSDGKTTLSEIKQRLMSWSGHQVVVPCRAGFVQSGQINNRPGRSGRPQGSNVLPGHFELHIFRR